MSGIFGRDKCAANLVMAMCLWCTADSLALNYPICSFSFSLLSKSCDYRQSSMFSPWNRCGVLSFKQRSHRSLRNAPIRGFAIPEVDYPRKDFEAPWNHFWASTRGLWAGKAIRPHLYGHSSSLRGTGLAHVPYFYSIGKLTTRSDFHRTVNWPHKSASRGHEIWHEVVLTHGRPWMAAINLWQFYPVSLIGLPMPLFQSHGKPNTPAFIRGLGDWPDKIASNEVCCDFEISSGDCHPHEWKLMAWCYDNDFSLLQTSLLRAAEDDLPNRVNNS